MGQWLSDGEPITHELTCRAFHRAIARDEQGYYLKIAHESQRIYVVDTPYFVVQLLLAGDLSQVPPRVRYSDGLTEDLELTSLQITPPRLCCRRRSGEWARFLPQPYYELLHCCAHLRDGRAVLDLESWGAGVRDLGPG